MLRLESQANAVKVATLIDEEEAEEDSLDCQERWANICLAQSGPADAHRLRVKSKWMSATLGQQLMGARTGE